MHADPTGFFPDIIGLTYDPSYLGILSFHWEELSLNISSRPAIVVMTDSLKGNDVKDEISYFNKIRYVHDLKWDISSPEDLDLTLAGLRNISCLIITGH